MIRTGTNRIASATVIFLLVATTALCEAQQVVFRTSMLESLLMPVSNNAVATITVGQQQFIVSFLGIGPGKSFSDTLSGTMVLAPESGRWKYAAPVPGGAGRLAAVAVSIGELAYVFGGYTVAEDGTEVSTPWTHTFNPVSGKFRERAAMPVPVDDAVAVTYAERYIFLISGWHDVGNVNLVQRYDTQTDTWRQATPVPGRAVFGHAGGIVGNRIVYCDGVAIRPHADKSRDYVANDECFIGIIDEQDSRRIDWRTIDAHPGAPRYRMAAVGVTDRQSVMFIGGTQNPYNFNGIGYDGRPSEPAADALLFDVNSLTWQRLRIAGTATMDHRGLVAYGDGWLTIGGMLSGQAVTDQVIRYTFQ